MRIFAARDRLFLEKSFMEIIKYRTSQPFLPLHPSFSTCLITFPPTLPPTSLIFPSTRNSNSAISFCLWQPLYVHSSPPCCRINSFLSFNLSLSICLSFLSLPLFLSFPSSAFSSCPFLNFSCYCSFK